MVVNAGDPSKTVTAATPLATLPALVLDLETTGLDVARDRVVQIGAWAMSGRDIDAEPELDRLVHPGIAIPPASTRIHRIDDRRVADAPPFRDHVELLAAAIDGRVVVGHHIAFDLAILRFEAGRAGIAWRDPRSLDVALLAGALEPTLQDLGLETLASWLNVPVEGRHSATGDCLITARVFVGLLARLRERGLRTLAEAESLQRRRDDLLLREAQAGWHRQPGDTSDAAEPPPPGEALVDSFLHRNRLVDVMQSPVYTVDAGDCLRSAARAMLDHRIGSLVVTDGGGHALGMLTERDLLRASGDPAVDFDRARVADWMNSPLESMRADDFLYRALARMARKKFRHLPVLDAAGEAVGIVSERDLLRYRAEAANWLGDRLASADNLAELANTNAQLAEVAAALREEGLDGVEVANIVSSEICALTARVGALAQREIEDQLGPPPAEYCLLVLGSAGRGESLLGADQDNALIHAGKPEDDDWYAEFGRVLAAMLDTAGIPRCRGEVMACNALWRGTLMQWQDRVRDWLRRTRPDDLLNVDIFFDMYPVHGDEDLYRKLREFALDEARRQPPFIGLLADSVVGMHTSLKFFGGFRTDGGRIDLKLGGLLPLVSTSRVLALKSGSRAHSTPERLRDAARRKCLPQADAERLAAVHRLLMTQVLRQQLRDLPAGTTPSGRVEIKTLSRTERRALRKELGWLEDILSTLRATVAD